VKIVKKKRKAKPYTYAEALKNLRQVFEMTGGAKEITQAELARRLGVSLSTVCKWEQGIRSPRGLYKAKVDRLLVKKNVKVPE
jgi:DNA-binding transcriptional regulator YiaG